MAHPLVDQVRFARSEFQRGLAGVTDEEARRRFVPMNSIGWIVGHLAAQENKYWMIRGQAKNAAPELEALVGHGSPPSRPPLDEMWAAWHHVTQTVDPWLDTLTTESLQTFMIVNGKPHDESIGSMLRRVAYHYFYHLGEAQAIRQLLGHTNLPEFIGDIQIEAPYRPE